MTLSAGTSFGGGGLFGNKTTTSTFGIPTITTTSAFSFGAVKTTATTGFGLSTKTTSSGLFGSGGTGSLFSGIGTSANKGFGGFGSLATSSANNKPFGGFGGLGSNTLSSSKGFGGFGTSSNSLGVASGNSLQTSDSNDLAALLSAVSVPKVFEDDRDTIMAKFNQIQAFLGVGQGYFNKISNPINFTMENPFCKFKSVGYSCKPSEPDSAGLVALTINKKDQEVKSQQQHLVEALQKLFGNKPNLAVFVEVVKPLPENKTEVVIYLMERDTMGNSRRFSSSEVSNFLNQANLRTQLTSLGVSKVVAKADLTEEQLMVYLNNPPSGIHPILWEQARKDNPSPQRLVPVPILGFEQLQGRIKFQQQETTLHQNALEILSDDITMLQQKHTETLTKLTEYKRRFLDLSHRVLKVISKQEVKRKSGCSIQLDEEDLRIQFETQLSSLNGPTHFKGRLNELVAQLRLQQQAMGNSYDGRYSLEKSVQLDLKQHLEKQQEGLMHLTGVIRQDFEDLKLIEQGLHEPIPRR